ncbi:MAG: hypothetical protein KGO03_13655 [Gemmatimonadota bacterium]|nr:hypothetical protein [Gemmatimonadota bacterium]
MYTTSMPPRVLRWVALLGVAALAPAVGFPQGAGAQHAVVVVLVRDAGTGVPLSGARILLDHALRADTTDAGGIARLRGVSPGSHLVALHLIGYAPDSMTVSVADTGIRIVETGLRENATALPGVTAHADAIDSRLEGFMARRAKGAGFFFTRHQIDSSKTLNLAELLRSGSVARMIPGPGGEAWLVSPSGMLNGLSGTTPCFTQVYWDGVMIYNPLARGGLRPDLRSMLTMNLEAVEYYPNPASTPVQFRTGAPTCGTLVLWSRMR